MNTVTLHPADGHNALGRRVRQVARYYNGGAPLSPDEAIGVVLDRLLEAERTLAKVTFALNGDERRAA